MDQYESNYGQSKSGNLIIEYIDNYHSSKDRNIISE